MVHLQDCVQVHCHNILQYETENSHSQAFIPNLMALQISVQVQRHWISLQLLLLWMSCDKNEPYLLTIPCIVVHKFTSVPALCPFSLFHVPNQAKMARWWPKRQMVIICSVYRTELKSNSPASCAVFSCTVNTCAVQTEYNIYIPKEFSFC